MPVSASEDDLKRRARRRLIGAVALTLAAVIVLPLMLEDEPPPAGKLAVNMPPAAELPPVAETAPVLSAAPTLPIAEPAAPPAAPPAEKPTEPALVVPPETKSPVKPNPIAKTESNPPLPDQETSAFVVQLGAFSDAAKTTALKSQVDTLGLSSYTDKSGALTRLRVGPFASREAAVEAAARLDEAGLAGQVMPK